VVAWRVTATDGSSAKPLNCFHRGAVAARRFWKL